jgi:hypothetical protein
MAAALADRSERPTIPGQPKRHLVRPACPVSAWDRCDPQQRSIYAK